MGWVGHCKGAGPAGEGGSGSPRCRQPWSLQRAVQARRWMAGPVRDERVARAHHGVGWSGVGWRRPRAKRSPGLPGLQVLQGRECLAFAMLPLGPSPPSQDSAPLQNKGLAPQIFKLQQRFLRCASEGAPGGILRNGADLAPHGRAPPHENSTHVARRPKESR